MKRFAIRAARPVDFPDILRIENRCFSPVRRASRRALAQSLRSPTQSVWLAVECRGNRSGAAGALILHHRTHSLRVNSLAVLPAYRGEGVGRLLMEHADDVARSRHCRYISLEADRRDQALVHWYERLGYQTIGILADYYAPGRDAVRMRRVYNDTSAGAADHGRA